MHRNPRQVGDLARLLLDRPLILSGAGISAASGIPTFRGSDGLYEGLNPYELASPEAFRHHPAKIWNWYIMRLKTAKDAQPNAAHYALADLERIAQQVTIVTSNVDPLHQWAGSRRVFRLHGDILQTLCSGCGRVDSIDLDTWPDSVASETLPTCTCGSVLRPNVVWFGESPWEEAFEAMFEALPHTSIFVEVGVSGQVTYDFTEAAIMLEIPVLRLNPDGVEQPGVVLIREPAEKALPELVELAKQIAG